MSSLQRSGGFFASAPHTVAALAGVAGYYWQRGKGLMSICEENGSQNEVYTRMKIMKKICVWMKKVGCEEIQ